jgi:hypothetical protein
VKSKDDRGVVIRIFSKDKDFVKAIKEIASNTVNKNIPLTVSDKIKLKKYKSVLLDLSYKGGKKSLVQSGGGFLPLLVPIVTTVLSSMLNGSD